MKNTIQLVIVSFLSFGVFVGCGEDPDKKADQNTVSSASTSEKKQKDPSSKKDADAAPSKDRSSDGTSGALVTLDPSLKKLKNDFNAFGSKNRLLMSLSPT